MMYSSKQTHMFNYFTCYHLEIGWHVTRPNQDLSLGRGKSLGKSLGKSVRFAHPDAPGRYKCVKR